MLARHGKAKSYREDVASWWGGWLEKDVIKREGGLEDLVTLCQGSLAPLVGSR